MAFAAQPGAGGKQYQHGEDFQTAHQHIKAEHQLDQRRKIRKADPDLIVFTGDSIDKEHSIDNYRDLLEGICNIAPIYYVNGNHEYDRMHRWKK